MPDSRPETTTYRFAIGCGGTGGHIVPGIALAKELHKRGNRFLFIGNEDGMEARMVAAEGFDFRGIRVQKLYRKISLAQLFFPLRLLLSTLRTLIIYKEYQPDAVLCTGGFVSGPVALAALIRKIPLYFHESNSLPGITTKYLARYTRITFTAFSVSAKYLKSATIRQLGIPLPEREASLADFDPSQLALSGKKPVILITGGSQGSAAINAAVDTALPTLLDRGFEVIWQTGKAGFAQYSVRHAGLPGVHIFDFSNRLASYYRMARLAITRAGALTLAELEANRLPAILIPLPTAAENHQYYNALEQQKRGFAIILKQNQLTPQTLLNAVRDLMQGYDKYKDKLSALAPNRAAHDIVQTILTDLDKEVRHAG